MMNNLHKKILGKRYEAEDAHNFDYGKIERFMQQGKKT